MNVQQITRAAIATCTPPTRYRLAKTLRIKWKTVDSWAKGERSPQAHFLLAMMQMIERGPDTAVQLKLPLPEKKTPKPRTPVYRGRSVVARERRKAAR